MQTPAECPKCGKENTEASGGNGWFCATHYAEVVAGLQQQLIARQEEAKLNRQRAARKAVETKKQIKDGTYVGRRKNMAEYNRIRDRYIKAMGW